MSRVTTTAVFTLVLFTATNRAAGQPGASASVLSSIDCVNGSAAGYGCSNLNLYSLLPRTSMAGPIVNEVWGWTDELLGREYAIVGHRDGTNIVDVTNPSNPIYMGNLPIPSGSFGNAWRDVKTFENYLFVVADNAGQHGLQIFNLNELRNVTNPPVTFQMTAHYTGIASAHNLAINEETGFAYVVGANSGGTTCGAGMHMIDISNPEAPVFAGCYNDGITGLSSAGYTHDAQCVVYRGPDVDYKNEEICITSNESDVTVVNVEDKANPYRIAHTSYPRSRYVHQGWLTEDHRYFIQGDELDELVGLVTSTRTLIWDMMDLDDPVLLKEFFYNSDATDHNLYVKGNFVYAANYTSGLHVIDISDPADPVEVAFFDTVQGDDSPGFDGAWGSYPFFPSGNIAIASAQEGLFMVRPAGLALATDQPTLETVSIEVFPNPATDRITIRISTEPGETMSVSVYDALGRRIRTLHQGAIRADNPLSLDTAGFPSGQYFVRATNGAGYATIPFSIVR